MVVVLFLVSDRQGFASGEGCPAGEGVEAANLGDYRAWNRSVGDRRDHGALHHRRRLRLRWRRRKAHLQGLAVLRGPLRPHPRPHRNPQFASPQNPQSRNGHSRRKNTQRSRGRCWQRTQHWIHPFPSELAQVHSGPIQFRRQVETTPWLRPKTDVLNRILFP